MSRLAPFLTLSLSFLALAPASLRAEASTYVDPHGVLRWTANQQEVAQFGVNYTAPFAYSFRAHRRLGVPIEKAIDADVYHFARLGLDAYRVHIWDREISDAEGNLLANEHLRAFDYLVAQLKARGIKIVLTAMQFGDASYPDPGVPLPGFSAKYGKRGCLENRTSWPLQERYLAQLLNHVNPLTGQAYKNDPDIVGFEICNEPGHFDYQPTVDYINTMVHAMRSTGCEKPIFYNMSHGIPVHQAYLDAEVQGGTFQWYPTNLLAGHQQRGNFLPYVDHYSIPFANEKGFQNKAKIAYEFDAADVGNSYIYPAIARSFRTAGFQFATQFAYDPIYLAPCNTEYQTHFMNLAYAPSKALGLKIAGEAFRRVPLGKDYGDYPNNRNFAGVTVDYEHDLAELITDKEYYYSNTTVARPPHPDQLERIAGFGPSPLINYNGDGAYFLDRLEPGVWRLEVMPDAVWVHDPFERASPHKTVARLAWNRWSMTIDLPDLGQDFAIAGLNSGNKTTIKAERDVFSVAPGVYLLTRAGARPSRTWDADTRWQNIKLGEFFAPPASIDKTYVLHTPARAASAGEDLAITAIVAAPQAPESVELVVYAPQTLEEELRVPEKNPRAQPGGGNPPRHASAKIPMQARGLHYSAVIPKALLRAGTLKYYIVVKTPSQTTTFPSDIVGTPSNWDFYGDPWSVAVTPPDAPVLLFNASEDAAQVTADHRDLPPLLVPSALPGTTAMLTLVPELTDAPNDYSWRFYFKDNITARRDRLKTATRLVVLGRSYTSGASLIQLALVTSDGATFGATVTLDPKSGQYSVPLTALKPVRSPNIPHGYPVYLPDWSPARTGETLDLTEVESLLVSIGPGLPETERAAPHAMAIERAWLE